MSAGVLLVVLCAALLHASWNLLVKAGDDTLLGTAGVYTVAGLLAALAVPFLPLPAVASWPYLLASTVAGLLYGVLLSVVYRSGDLSHAYPLMRGGAPLLVALGSGALIGERLPPAVWIGIALVSCGLFSMIFEARWRGHSTAATGFSLLNALLLATCTTADGLGVRLSTQPLAYSLWLYVLNGAPWLVWLLPRIRAQRWPQLRPKVVAATVGGLFAMVSYTLALWAMTRTAVAAVAAVRETSIIFATALGAIVLNERVGRLRALAAVAIALGVWAIRGH